MKRIVRTIVGSIVLLAGLLMLALPGPALLVIPLGLAILAIDFHWAKVVMQKARIGFTPERQTEPPVPNPHAGKTTDKAGPQDMPSSSQSTASGSGLSTAL